jgi:hypothetical protein
MSRCKCSPCWIGHFRLVLVLCQWSLVFVGINAVSHVYVPEPRRTPPPPDAQQWTYKVDPLCATANQSRMVMQAVHCVGGVEWTRGCEYKYYSRIPLNGWWVSASIAFVVLSCVYVVIAAFATCTAQDQTDSARRDRQQSLCERLFQENMALTFFNGANLAHILLILCATALILGYAYAPSLRRCAPLDPSFNAGLLPFTTLVLPFRLD